MILPIKLHTLLCLRAGGFTPLMIASFCGNGLDTGVHLDSSGSRELIPDEHPSTAIIGDLLKKGANVHSQTDWIGVYPSNLENRVCG